MSAYARVWVAVVEGSIVGDRLFTELFETRHYNKYSYPVANLTETIHVQLGIKLLKIVEVVCILYSHALASSACDVPANFVDLCLLSYLWHINSTSPWEDAVFTKFAMPYRRQDCLSARILLIQAH